jgi:SAM-dependent methyltransferase
MTESKGLTKEEILTEYYRKQYHSCLYGTRCQSIGTKYFDHRLESSWVHPAEPPKKLLEVGFASGEHISRIKVFPKLEYVGLDINRPTTQVYIDALVPEMRSKLKFVQSDAAEMPFENNTFDRVVSTCLLHHVKEPLKVLQEIRRVTENKGQIAIGLPADPGLLNRMVKYLITYPAMRKLGVEHPKFIYALEHPNQIGGLLEIVKYVFYKDQVKVTFFPFRIRSWNLNLLAVVHIQIKKLDE